MFQFNLFSFNVDKSNAQEQCHGAVCYANMCAYTYSSKDKLNDRFMHGRRVYDKKFEFMSSF